MSLFSKQSDPSAGNRELPRSQWTDEEKQEKIREEKRVLEKDKADLTSALSKAKTVRRSVIQKIRDSPYAHGNETEFLNNAAMFTQVQAVIQRMMEHSEHVDRDMEDLRIAAEIGSAYDFLGCRSLPEWSMKVREWSKDLCHFLTAISAFGAGITYTTIFSASRGSVGLMSWSFTLFCMALSLPTGTQCLLAWSASMPPTTKAPWAGMKLWNTIIGFCMIFSCFSAIGAVYLLLLSVYQVQYSPIASGASSQLEYTNSPRRSFWLATGFISAGCLHIVLINLLFIWRNDWKALSAIYSIGAKQKDEHPTSTHENLSAFTPSYL